MANILNKLKQINNKTYMPLVYGMLFLLLLFLFIFLNILFIADDSNTGTTKIFNDFWFTLNNWNESSMISIKMGIYNIFATIIAAVGLAIAAIASQSLTRNPLAEGSTLGLVQAAIFGIILMIASGLLTTGIANLFMKYTFALIFGSIAAILIIAITIISKLKTNSQKIIMAGLAIGIIFKTLSFIFKFGDKNASQVNFNYVLGGAESISSNPISMPENDMLDSLLFSSILIFISLIMLIINSKGMNIMELGEDRSKTIGINPKITKIICLIILCLSVPASVILVGNIAFLGLFAVHVARWLTNSRDNKKIIPFAIIVSLTISQISLQLTEHLPQVNSGLWMTFIGAPYLIYIGIRGLK